MTDDVLMKLHVHSPNKVIYIQYTGNLHDIPFIGYLVIAEDGRTDAKTDRRKDNAKPISLRLQGG